MVVGSVVVAALGWPAAGPARQAPARQARLDSRDFRFAGRYRRIGLGWRRLALGRRDFRDCDLRLGGLGRRGLFFGLQGGIFGPERGNALGLRRVRRACFLRRRHSLGISRGGCGDIVGRDLLGGRRLDPQQGQHGLDASLGCANIVAGAARHDGLLANSSWAARSSAAAPSPKTRIDIDNTIAENRKRKPGSMNANSAFAGCAKAIEHRERGDHQNWPRPRRIGHRRRAANQADFRIPQRLRRHLLKIGPGNARRHAGKAFFQA